MFTMEKTAYIMKEILTDEWESGMYRNVTGQEKRNRIQAKKDQPIFKKNFEKDGNVTGRVTIEWYNLTVTW